MVCHTVLGSPVVSVHCPFPTHDFQPVTLPGSLLTGLLNQLMLFLPALTLATVPWRPQLSPVGLGHSASHFSAVTAQPIGLQLYSSKHLPTLASCLRACSHLLAAEVLAGPCTQNRAEGQRYCKAQLSLPSTLSTGDQILRCEYTHLPITRDDFSKVGKSVVGLHLCASV